MVRNGITTGSIGFQKNADSFPQRHRALYHCPVPIRMARMFIVFDGVDGAGKSTQLKLAGEYLQATGRTVVHCSDPGSTALGQKMRKLVLDHHDIPVSPRSEAFLFLAARAQLVDEIIQPSLDAGKVVLCDRFTFSTVVYQGHAGLLKPGDIWAANQLATGGLHPVLTVLFDLSVEQAAVRMGNRQPDRMESRGAEYLEEVRNGFLYEAKRWPHGVEVVDATGTTEEVFARIRVFLDQLLEAETE